MVGLFSGHEFEQLQEIVKDREAWHAEVHGWGGGGGVPGITKSWT